MDLRKVKKLIELVEESGISELEVSSADESVRIRMGDAGSREVVTTPAVVPALTTPAPAAAPTPSTGAIATVTAPMAGTFYRAAHPEAAPFVEVGDRVEAGDVLCIIESMKMMNEIPAEVDGVVIDVLVADGEPVARGQGLFRIGR